MKHLLLLTMLFFCGFVFFVSCEKDKFNVQILHRKIYRIKLGRGKKNGDFVGRQISAGSREN